MPVNEMPAPLVFTDNAANKVKPLIEEEGNTELKLRVFVTGGGCSGFQYGFTFDEVTNEDDTAMQKNGVTLLIDPMSYQYLVGRRDRLPGRPRGRAVRDQEPERDHHLRLRFVVLRLDRPRPQRRDGASGSRCLFHGSRRVDRAQHARSRRAGDGRQVARLGRAASRAPARRTPAPRPCSTATPCAAVGATPRGAERARRALRISAALRAPPPQTRTSLRAAAVSDDGVGDRCARSARAVSPERRPCAAVAALGELRVEPRRVEQVAPGALGRRQREDTARPAVRSAARRRPRPPRAHAPSRRSGSPRWRTHHRSISTLPGPVSKPRTSPPGRQVGQVGDAADVDDDAVATRRRGTARRETPAPAARPGRRRRCRGCGNPRRRSCRRVRPRAPRLLSCMV